MKNEPPDADGLRTLLATILAGVPDTSPAEWTKLIGDVEILPIVFNPRCNWSVSPSGTPDGRDAIGKRWSWYERSILIPGENSSLETCPDEIGLS